MREMNEERAREILCPTEEIDWLGEGGVKFTFCDWATWCHGDDTVMLDGRFNADELEAIAWWMRNKDTPPPPSEKQE